VSIVEGALKEHHEDFLTVPEIQRMFPELTRNIISAALFHLRKYRAADIVVQDGIGHWIGTPESDTRYTKRELRVPESRPRRPRRGRRNAVSRKVDDDAEKGENPAQAPQISETP